MIKQSKFFNLYFDLSFTDRKVTWYKGNRKVHSNKAIFSQPTQWVRIVWQHERDSGVSSTALRSALIYVPGTETLERIQEARTFLYGGMLLSMASESANEICYSQSVHQNVLPQVISSSIIHSAIIWQQNEREWTSNVPLPDLAGLYSMRDFQVSVQQKPQC